MLEFGGMNCCDVIQVNYLEVTVTVSEGQWLCDCPQVSSGYPQLSIVINTQQIAHIGLAKPLLNMLVVNIRIVYILTCNPI